MTAASAPGRAAVLTVTAAVAVLVGAIVALINDEARMWISLGVLGASVGAYCLSRVGRRTTDDRSVVVSHLPLAVRASYVAGLATGGLLVLRPGGALTVSDLVFVASFGLCLAYLIRGDRPLRPISPWIGIGVGIFAVGALVSSVGASQVGESLGILLRFGFVAWAWLWLGVQVIDDWWMLRASTTAWAVGGALAASGAVMQALFGDVIPGTAIAWGRMTGFTQNVNDLGGLCAIALPISISMITDAVRNRRRWVPLYVGLGLLNFAGLILSGSVGGFVAAAVGLLAVGLTTRWSVGMVVAAIAAAVGAATLVLAFGVGTSVIQHYGVVTGPAGDPSATFWTRLETISAAWRVMQRQPLVGVGLAPGGAVTDTGYAVHNVLIAAWYQAGILGLIGIALLLGVATIQGLRGLREVPRRDQHRDIVAGIVGSLAAAVVVGFAGSVLYQRYFWVPTAMVLAVRTVGQRQVSRSTLAFGRRPTQENRFARWPRSK
jgi:hypothetical protein